jgi:hypothetical protein
MESKEELEFRLDVYNRLMKKLTTPFGKEAVIVDQKRKRAYIPSELYRERLESVCGPLWEYRRVGPAIFHEREQLIEVHIILSILGTERSGTGFANYEVHEQTGRIISLKTRILSAEADALRNACAKFGMGEADLKPFRDQLDESRETAKEALVCKRCHKPLTKKDLDHLKSINLHLLYHINCVPEHFYHHGSR